VEVVEQRAEEEAEVGPIPAVRAAAGRAYRKLGAEEPFSPPLFAASAAYAATEVRPLSSVLGVADQVGHAFAYAGLRERERTGQAGLVRCIFPNPFRPATRDPAWHLWNGGTIPTLAKVVYEERQLPSGHLDPVRLPLLADMLEDAGCSDPSILEHLRGPGPHVRGCWPVDLVLGKV
jgi:hypothetical protein